MKTSRHILTRAYQTATLGMSLMIPLLGTAQERQLAPPPVSPPVLPGPVALPQAVVEEKIVVTPIPPPDNTAIPAPALPATPGKSPVTVGADGIRLNFQGAALSEVLNYLSEAAGLVIVQEVPVTGTVNIVSRQGIDTEEVVDLLNAVLLEKGFAAVRNGRILKIVNRKDAMKYNLPVESGSDPAKIPRKDGMVTQILPLRYGEAAKLVENLRPLLSDSATITSNDSSNAILLTDTQNNIHRIALIIRALDTSVAGISSIRVYPLRFADSTKLATIVTQLFAVPPATGGNTRGGGGVPGFGGFGGFGGGRGGGGQAAAAAPQSEARQAASRVVAVADEQSNALIVSAPDELFPEITEIVNQIDTSITDITNTRIFRLRHADAVETAQLITTLYADTTAQGGNQNTRRGQGQGRGAGQGGQAPAAAGAQRSERSLLQSKVVAVGDARTNSLLLTAAQDTMLELSELIGRLDSTDAKKQRVYVHSLEHADAEGVATVLRGMLNGGSATQAPTSRLTERTTTGAAINATNSTTGGVGGGVR